MSTIINAKWWYLSTYDRFLHIFLYFYSDSEIFNHKNKYYLSFLNLKKLSMISSFQQNNVWQQEKRKTKYGVDRLHKKSARHETAVAEQGCWGRDMVDIPYS